MEDGENEDGNQIPSRQECRAERGGYNGELLGKHYRKTVIESLR